MPLPDLEVVIVSGRRPELLDQTLASFQERVFRHFNIVRVRINIDPFGGDAAAHQECRDIARARFDNPKIYEPETAGFTAAVQRLWSGVDADRVFHLEDDWLANEDITPERIGSLGKGSVASVTLQSAEHQWLSLSTRMVRRRRRKFMGLSFGRRLTPVFGTSPRFLTAEFARGCADLMDLRLDPEKQMRDGRNPKLCRYIAKFESEILLGQDGGMVITDIGRAWRDQHKLLKMVKGGVSHWVPDEAQG